MSRAGAPPRLLIVSPVASHPPDQGNAARILALAAALSARGVLCEFLYHTAEGMTAAQEAAMRAHWPGFHVNHAERRPEPCLPGAWGLDDWCPPSLVARVAGLQRARRYDAVLVNYVWMSGVLAGLGDAPPLRLLDTHDLFGGRRAVAMAAGLDPSWFFTTEAEEGRGLARADLVLAIQDGEAAVLAARGARRVMVVGHAAAPRFLTGPALPAPRAPYGVLASGNPWNLAAVRALDAALAGLGEGPGAPRWLLAGSILRALDGGAALRSAPLLLPAPERAEDFYDAVGCVLAPNTGGTGLKIKTVEALMSGRPVLGTAHAFAGLPAAHVGFGLPAAHVGPGLPASHVGPGLPAAHVGSGLPAAHVGSGLPAAHVGPGLPAAHVGPGLPASHVGSGLPASHVGPGLPAAHPAHAAEDMAGLAALLARHAACAGYREEVARATRHRALAVAAAVAVQHDALAAVIAGGPVR